MKTTIDLFSSSSSVVRPNQLELRLDVRSRSINRAVRRRRRAIASLWFRRMHQVVGSAREFKPAIVDCGPATPAPEFQMDEHKMAA